MADEFVGGANSKAALAHDGPEVDATDTKGIHLAVKLAEEVCGLLDVAIGANAF